MIDLKTFCSVRNHSDARKWMKAPVSSGEYTYATDGVVMVRVPFRSDVLEMNVGVNLEKPYEQFPCEVFDRYESIAIAANDDNECTLCDGRGHEHDCPECHCQCERCYGTGTLPLGHDVSIEISGVSFAARYILLLQTLPGILLGKPKNGKSPLPFKFDGGGEGRLMPLRLKFEQHIVAKLAGSK